MARLSANVTIALGAALVLSGCFQTTRVASVDRALAMAKPALADSTAASSQQGAPALTLSCSDAVARALARDPALAALRAAAAADTSRVAAAGGLDNPELRFTNVDFDRVADNSELTLRAKPPLPGAPSAREQVARSRSDRSESDAERAAQLLANKVERFFYEAQLSETAAAVAASAAELESRRIALAEREQAHGLVTRTDAADLATSLFGERQRADEAARRFAESKANLLDLLGLPYDAGVKLVGDPLDPAALDTMLTTEGDAVERALRQRPEVRAAGAAIDGTTAREWLERSEQWPWFSFVQFGYDFQPSGLESWTAGLAVELPIFNLNRDAIHASEADALSARRSFEATVREIATDVRTSLARARSSGDELRRFREGPGAAASAAREATVSARKAGQANERDLLRAEEKWLDARRIELELLDDYIAARARLLADLGE